MRLRVILAKGASAERALRSLVASRETRVWIPDQPSPYDRAPQRPPFDGVLALPAHTNAPVGLETACAYQASEVVAKHGPRTGIGLLALLRPFPGLSRAEVHRHWDEHIALANVVHHKATSYRQFRFSSAVSAEAPEYSGFAILHFPSAEALRTGLYRNAQDMEAIRADVAEFAAGADTMFVTEYEGI